MSVQNVFSTPIELPYVYGPETGVNDVVTLNTPQTISGQKTFTVAPDTDQIVLPEATQACLQKWIVPQYYLVEPTLINEVTNEQITALTVPFDILFGGWWCLSVDISAAANTYDFYAYSWEITNSDGEGLIQSTSLSTLTDINLNFSVNAVFSQPGPGNDVLLKLTLYTTDDDDVAISTGPCYLCRI
jgi:hypothetical protein